MIYLCIFFFSHGNLLLSTVYRKLSMKFPTFLTDIGKLHGKSSHKNVNNFISIYSIIITDIYVFATEIF